MILDSHAHYISGSFENHFRYLDRENGTYSLREGDRMQLFARLEEAGIRCSIEPGTSLASQEAVLALAEQMPGRVFPAVGVHPTRAIRERWLQRRQLFRAAGMPQVIAIGETGLDYHYQRKDQQRLRQKLWFLYQLDLARRVKKPLILHIRDAHRDALRILSRYPGIRQGGVVHCFYGSREIAESYVNLGLHIGIGGTLLQQGERGEQLREAIAAIPMERILLETDAPYILPYCKDVLSGKQLRRARNTSLILPAVAEAIAQIKGLTREEVERITAENTVALFHLPKSLLEERKNTHENL